MRSEALSQDPTLLTGDNNSSSSSHSGGIRKLSGTEDDDEMLVLDNGGSTPNDVRHFPPSPSPQSQQSQQSQSHPYLLSASMNVLGNERRGQRSAAVPISQLDRSPHKLGHDEERMLMEYRESLMYSRIVDFHQSRRRNSLQMAETTTVEEDTTTKVTLPLLLRPRAHYQQDVSLVEMLSNRPHPHPHERRRPMNAAGADLFPLRGEEPSSRSNNNVENDEHEDDDDDEDDSDHHHHEEVFDLDL
jgi:hypothetical protein